MSVFSNKNIIKICLTTLTPSSVFVGKAFAENSSSTSLQRVALRREKYTFKHLHKPSRFSIDLQARSTALGTGL